MTLERFGAPPERPRSSLRVPQDTPRCQKGRPRVPKGGLRRSEATRMVAKSLPRADKLILWKSSFRLHKTIVFRSWDAPESTPSRQESPLKAPVERLRARKVGRGACRKACRATRGARSLEGHVRGPVGRVGIPPRSPTPLRLP